MVSVLIAFFALDILGGLLVAYGAKTISSSVSRRGFARKMMMLLLVAGFGLLDGFLPPLPVPVIGNTTWAGFCSFCFCFNEFVSLLEKAALLGVRLPPRLLWAIKKYRETISLADDASGNVARDPSTK